MSPEESPYVRPHDFPAYGKAGVDHLNHTIVRCNYRRCNHTGINGTPVKMSCGGLTCDCPCCQCLAGAKVYGVRIG